MNELVATALASGGLVGIVAWARERWRARQPAAIEQASLAVVAKARDELAEDNQRLREELTEERGRHAEDRARWSAEKAGFIAEIDSLWATVADLRKRVHAALPNPPLEAS